MHISIVHTSQSQCHLNRISTEPYIRKGGGKRLGLGDLRGAELTTHFPTRELGYVSLPHSWRSKLLTHVRQSDNVPVEVIAMRKATTFRRVVHVLPWLPVPQIFIANTAVWNEPIPRMIQKEEIVETWGLVILGTNDRKSWYRSVFEWAI